MKFLDYSIKLGAFVIFCQLLTVVSCSNADQSKEKKLNRASSQEEVTSSAKDATITAPSDSSPRFIYQIIDAPDGTFGYEIIAGGKVMIHQPNIPGMPGLAGFAEKESAVKVAELVIRKLTNNEMPPTVTIEELKELEVER